jgi:effector-binding domain-containing protein
VPGGELAVITHRGSHADLDRSYEALATYVSERALAVDGLIREYYVVGPHDTNDESAWRTEIGWPIFEARPIPTMISDDVVVATTAERNL